jgi:hypothetical protein
MQKKSKVKVEVNQTLSLDCIKKKTTYQALAGAFSATSFPL